MTVTDYDTGGRAVERRVYRPDGTLSFHEAYQYEADPRASAIQVLDAQGAVISTRRVLRGPEGAESTVFNASGEITERTRTRRDLEGRVIEAVTEDTVRDEIIRMQIDYRAGPAEAHVTFSGRPERDIHLVAGAEGTSVSCQDSCGSRHEFRPVVRRTVVESRDAEGNWTRQILLERDPASGDEVVTAARDRMIEYY